jgi:hypothetical protein
LSRILDAACQAGQVQVQETIVDAEILSEGNRESSGILILDGSRRPVYLTSNAEDIKDLISDLEEIIEQIQTILTTIDGVTTSPGSAAASIVALGVLNTALGATKETLK